MDCIPVALDLDDLDLRIEVGRYVEQELGWQVVVDSPQFPAALFLSDRPLARRPYVLVLATPADRERYGQGERDGGSSTGLAHDLPLGSGAGGEATLWLGHSPGSGLSGASGFPAVAGTSSASGVPDGSGVSDASGWDRATALAHGAIDMIHWPEDKARLASIDSTRLNPPTRRSFVISPVQPQVGTSTLTIAIGAILGWSGKRVALAADPSILAATGMQRVGRVLACPNLWLVNPDAGAPRGFDIHLIQAPASTQTSLLVGRPNRATVRLGCSLPGVPVITVGEGEFLTGELKGFLGRRRLIHLDWSQRIARAGLRGALPQAFPGRMLRDLADGLSLPVPGHRKGANTRPKARRNRPTRQTDPQLVSAEVSLATLQQGGGRLTPQEASQRQAACRPPFTDSPEPARPPLPTRPPEPARAAIRASSSGSSQPSEPLARPVAQRGRPVKPKGQRHQTFVISAHQGQITHDQSGVKARRSS